MSLPLLTIAIPTYNRAKKVDRQLIWLLGAIDGLEDQCERILSDNASKRAGDATVTAMAMWDH